MADVTSIYGNPIKDAVARQDISDLKSDKDALYDSKFRYSQGTIYGYVDASGRISASGTYKYSKIDVTGMINPILKFTAAQGAGVDFATAHTIDNRWRASGKSAGDIDIDLSDCDYVYLNFFGSAYVAEYIISVDSPAVVKENIESALNYYNAIKSFDLDDLTIGGYLRRGTFYADASRSWLTSDEIAIDNSNFPLWVYIRAAGQYTSADNKVSNVAFYNVRNECIDYAYIEEMTPGTAAVTYETIIEVPANTTYMRLCTGNPRTVPFEAKIIKRADYVLADDKNIFNNAYILDIGKRFTTMNGYLDTSGNFRNVTESGWMATEDYIDCSGFDVAKYGLLGSSNAAVVAVYDKNKRMLRVEIPETSANVYTFGEGTIDISDASYIRICQFRHPDYLKATYCKLYRTGKKDTIPRYSHCVNKPFVFNGKTGYFFGDSITRGFTSGSTTTENGFPKLFSDAVGMSFVNYGVGGATIYPVSGLGCIQTQIQNANLDTPDYVFIAGGVNDWQVGVSLEDFRTGVQDICTYLSSNFSGEVIFIMPINEAGWTPVGTPIAELEEYRNILAEVVLQNEYSLVNGALFNFPVRDSATATINALFGDRLHPSEKGYRQYAKALKTVLC